MSYASIQRNRVKQAEFLAEQIKEKWVCPDAIVLHWDTKLIETLESKFIKEERIPILVSGKFFAINMLLNCLKFYKSAAIFS